MSENFCDRYHVTLRPGHGYVFWRGQDSGVSILVLSLGLALRSPSCFSTPGSTGSCSRTTGNSNTRLPYPFRTTSSLASGAPPQPEGFQVIKDYYHGHKTIDELKAYPTTWQWRWLYQIRTVQGLEGKPRTSTTLPTWRSCCRPSIGQSSRLQPSLS